MTLTVHCRTCGSKAHCVAFIDEVNAGTTIGSLIAKEATGWIARQNGDCYDTYCSKECAE